MVFIATNQSGIARGYFSEDEMHAFHKSLNNKLNESSCHIDGFYYCPFHPDGVIKKYKKESSFRKPDTGMLEEIQQDWSLEKQNMLMIGDSESDIICAKNFGIKSLHYSDKISYQEIKDFIYNSFKK